MRRVFSAPSASGLLYGLILAGFALSGCAVGPDFEKPAAPEVSAYDSSETAATTVDGAQKLAPGQDIPAQWWALFHSDGLNRLVVEAVQNNPDLASAEASLRVAEDNLSAEDAALFPTVQGSFSSQRQKTSAASNNGLFPGYYYTLHNASVSVSYNLDVFGGTRRAIEQLQAVSDEARFEREATYLTLTSNVVTSAIQEASLRDQIEATKQIIHDQEKNLTLLKAQFEAGAVSKSNVAAQQALLASARATLPPLEHQLVVTRHALSALLGKLPQQEPESRFTLCNLALPEQVPLSVPSKLVEQRPDVREAEENLHAASAAIGIAVAARLPQISLSADIGSMANSFSKLFSPGGGFWGLGGSAAETLFDAGALESKEDAARDEYKVAAEQYRKTVIGAFQNVADTLHALQSDAQELNAETDAEQAAHDSLILTQAQLQAGAVSTADLLNAELTEQQAKAALVRAKAQRYADTAALFAALGGGWWNRNDQNLANNEEFKSEKGNP